MEQQINPQNNIIESKSSNFILIIVCVIITAIFIGGIVYFWQQQTIKSESVKLQTSINVLKSKLNKSKSVEAELQSQILTLQDKILNLGSTGNNREETNREKWLREEEERKQEDLVTAQNNKITVEKIRSCASGEKDKFRLLDEDLINKLGISEYINSGYKVEDICSEENNIVSFILAKMEPNYYIESQDTYVCSNSCDKDIFGIIDIAKNKKVIKEFDDNLGIYSEAFSLSCQIDKIISDNENLSDSVMLFYCSNPEYGGFAWWKQYSYLDNSVTQIMNLKMLGNNYDDEYEIFSESILKLFRNQSRKDIYQK